MLRKSKLTVITIMTAALMLLFAGTAMAAPMDFVEQGTVLSGASRPAVVYDNGTYHMWYMEGSNLKYVTSTTPDTWDDTAVQQVKADGVDWVASSTTELGDNPFVLKVGSTFYMWATDNAGNVIRLYSSTDGVNWTYLKDVLSKGDSGAWDDRKIDEPMVIYDGTEYKMFYQGSNVADVPVYQIGMATTDSVTGVFTKETNPVLTPSASGWDSYRVFQPAVVQNGDELYMWYASCDSGSPDAIGFAYYDSTNQTWVKDDTPIIDTDGVQEALPAVLFVDGSWHMWYLSGSDIAYATAADFNKASANISFTVTASGTPGYEPIVGVSLSTNEVELGSIGQGQTANDAIVIINTGNVTESISYATEGNAANMIEITDNFDTLGTGAEGTMNINVSVPDTQIPGNYTATINITATAAQ